MGFYKVWVRSVAYRGHDALTYRHDGTLAAGTIVDVPLQQKSVAGIVIGLSERPSIPQVKAIEAVWPVPPVPANLLRLARWLIAYYPTPVGVVTQLLLPATPPKRAAAEAVALPPAAALPPLTSEQASALRAIDQPNTYLLHGRTGSGKTRIYVELARRQLAAGRSTLILSPEISLTGQLVKSFESLGVPVVVLHSQLTATERYRAWHHILTAETPLIIIGPRSALFSPIRDLGLIVIDEAHETAYKQEQAPYYHATRVASLLAELHQSILVLGSATPSITDYFVATAKHKPIIRLEKLAQTADVSVAKTVIDLKDRDQFTKSAFLSDALLKSIADSLRAGEQSLLYLNRRGSARLVLCQHCGWQAVCPHCDLPLVFHADSHQLRCHVCGHHQIVPTSCPVCSHVELVFKSIGTKAVVGEVERFFPEARVLRFDADNSKAERFEQQYEAVYSGEADILVGTQTLAKGLDLPRLSTLGVILADTSLYLPDYTAGERTYQLLHQVLGRIERGHRATRAFVQTYNPDSPPLLAALNHDWSNFYEAELAERKLFHYPPFCFILKLSCRRKSAKAAEKACQNLADKITGAGYKVQIDGPAPALHERVAGDYTWQLVIKAERRSDLLEILASLPASKWTHDIDPTNLL